MQGADKQIDGDALALDHWNPYRSGDNFITSGYDRRRVPELPRLAREGLHPAGADQLRAGVVTERLTDTRTRTSTPTAPRGQ